MQRVCPNAILINYTNPSGMVTDLTHRVSNVRTFGLCDGVIAVKGLMGELMGMPHDEAMSIEAYVYGVNHCTWALSLRYRGEDLYALLPGLIAKQELEKLAEKSYCYADACRLYRYYGILPGSLVYTRYYYTLPKIMKQSAAPGYINLSGHLRRQVEQVRSHIRSQIGKSDADFLIKGGYAEHGDQAI